jgi:hypothetical protein
MHSFIISSILIHRNNGLNKGRSTEKSDEVFGKGDSTQWTIGTMKGTSSGRVIMSFPWSPSPKRPDIYIDGRKLSLMKPGRLLINARRGFLVDERAVAEALQEGHLAGYAADIFETSLWLPDYHSQRTAV